MRIAAAAAGSLNFARRDPYAGFSTGEAPEVIVLEEPQEVDATPLGLHVQPGVRDRTAEIRLRSSRRMAFDAPPMVVARIPNAVVDARSFAVFLPSGEYLTESVRSPKSLLGAGFASDEGVLRREEAAVERRPGTAVVVGGPTHRNWFHWWSETMARLAVVKPFAPGNARYVVPPMGDWQLEALALTGLPSDRLDVVDGEGMLAYDEVLAPSRALGAINQFSPGSLRALRTMCADWPSAAGARLYVSRRAAKRRRVHDEAQVEATMARHGFATVKAESLSVREQIARFSDAAVIVGMHGAGLTNMLWAPPGLLVLELQGEGRDLGAATIYWHMSAALGHRYSACICPVEESAADQELIVDTSHLDALLQSLLPPHDAGAASSSSAASSPAR